MSHIFSIAQIRAIEDDLFKNHINAYDLMKKAGKAAYQMITQEYPKHQELVIFCGKGNNAGDAYIIADHALKNNYQVTFIELYEQLSPLAGKARDKVNKVNNCYFTKLTKNIKINPQALIIDAIFGIGFKGEVKGLEKQAIELMNNSSNQVIAIDIPSGLNGDNGQIGGIAVQADLTICFIAPKLGLFFGLAKDYVNKLQIADLDIPKEVFAKFANDYQLLDFDLLKKSLPVRKANDHKGIHGHALLIGGLGDMPGAAIMAAKACYRIGAGKVTIATKRKNYAIIAHSLPEAMFADLDKIDFATDFAAFTKQFNTLIIGPGLSQSSLAKQALQALLKLDQPKLIDADGLNLIAKHYQTEQYHNIIMTPHLKEAARLLNTDTTTILADRKKAIIELSKRYNAIIILKGEACLIKSPNNPTIFISPYGNKALATAGSGDVLSGIIGGLLAQKPTDYANHLLASAKLGTVIHGKIADLFADKYNHQSLLAGDLIEELKNLPYF